MKWIERIAKRIVVEELTKANEHNATAREALRQEVSVLSDSLKECASNIAKLCSDLDFVSNVADISGKKIDKINEDIIVQKDEIYKSIETIPEEMKEQARRIAKFEEIKQRMDDGIILMTKPELNKFIGNRLDIFEGGIDDKMVGLYHTVDERLASKNGKVKATAELMKKIARLEGIKDAVEHRLPTEEILKKVDEYKNKMMDLDRSGSAYNRFQDALNILTWVLGGDKK